MDGASLKRGASGGEWLCSLLLRVFRVCGMGVRLTFRAKKAKEVLERVKQRKQGEG